MATPYIAATIPAQTVLASHTTLFRAALTELGDAMQWVAIARLNKLIDPWVFGQEQLLIPPVLPTGTPTGLLTPNVGGATTTA